MPRNGDLFAGICIDENGVLTPFATQAGERRIDFILTLQSFFLATWLQELLRFAHKTNHRRFL